MTDTSPICSRAQASRGLPATSRGLPAVARGLAARWRGLRTAAAVALMCAALGGCLTGEQFQKGYILPPGALEQIPIGASQDQVLIVMGTPSTVATLSGERRLVLKRLGKLERRQRRVDGLQLHAETNQACA